MRHASSLQALLLAVLAAAHATSASIASTPPAPLLVNLTRAGEAAAVDVRLELGQLGVVAIDAFRGVVPPPGVDEVCVVFQGAAAYGWVYAATVLQAAGTPLPTNTSSFPATGSCPASVNMETSPSPYEYGETASLLCIGREVPGAEWSCSSDIATWVHSSPLVAGCGRGRAGLPWPRDGDGRLLLGVWVPRDTEPSWGNVMQLRVMAVPGRPASERPGGEGACAHLQRSSPGEPLPPSAADLYPVPPTSDFRRRASVKMTLRLPVVGDPSDNLNAVAEIVSQRLASEVAQPDSARVFIGSSGGPYGQMSPWKVTFAVAAVTDEAAQEAADVLLSFKKISYATVLDSGPGGSGSPGGGGGSTSSGTVLALVLGAAGLVLCAALCAWYYRAKQAARRRGPVDSAAGHAVVGGPAYHVAAADAGPADHRIALMPAARSTSA